MRICVPITLMGEADVASIVEKAAGMGASLIEFRLDRLKEGERLEDFVAMTPLPKIATARIRGEGGFYEGSEPSRIKLLLEAAESGFEYVDIELSTRNVSKHIKSFKERGVKVIVSKHFMEDTPPPNILRRTLEGQIKAGADITKIITTARSWEDNLAVLNFLSHVRERRCLICFAMGRLGIPSRILSPVLGGFCTYASIERGLETAEGQPSLKELKDVYQIMGVTELGSGQQDESMRADWVPH